MFQDHVWWITGASSGIGAALAGAMAASGARLILSGRNETALREVDETCGADCLVLPFEAAAFDELPAIVARAWSWAAERGTGIAGLVNNAGISQRSLAVDTAFDVYQRIIDVDLLAPIALTQALLPRMVAAGGDHLVAISSVACIAGVPMRSAYSAAKHGLIGYHDAVRAETAQHNIKVLVVAPGSVKTELSKNALDANARARGVSDAAIDNGISPQALAARILGALHADQRELIVAEGIEANIVSLRRSDPDALFDIFGALMASGYAQQFERRA